MLTSTSEDNMVILTYYDGSRSRIPEKKFMECLSVGMKFNEIAIKINTGDFNLILSGKKVTHARILPVQLPLSALERDDIEMLGSERSSSQEKKTPNLIGYISALVLAAFVFCAYIKFNNYRE